MKRNILIAAAIAAVTLAAIAADTQQPTVVKKKAALFNGKDLAGWTMVLADPNQDPKKVWSVKDGVLRCEGVPNGYIRTNTDYAEYVLHVEWRWADKPTNSGVLLHVQPPDKVWPKCIESQLMAENAGDIVLINGSEIKGHPFAGKQFEVIKKLKDSSEKNAGEWNSYDIICKDDCIVTIVNGVIQNVATGAKPTSGRIALQSEGSPIEFRNIYLEPVENVGKVQ